MRKIFLIILLIPLLSTAQRGGGYGGDYSKFSKKNKSSYFRGSISGKIIDSETKKGLEFASISITNTKWNKVIEGTISSVNGKFSMTGVLSGDYIISVNYLGYKQLEEVKFTLTKKNPDIRLSDILMVASSEMLSEITIDEQKPIYETKIDKIIYNAEDDNNGGSDDATDVLRKAPLLSVDFDGNVELRGSKQIKFLLNGKASSFLSGDLASALQMIPADEIKSVEIITSPGAKYDGEGDAGIVNIITQKKIIDGYKASIDGSIGTRNNKNGFNLTLGKGRFSLSARGSIRYSWPREGTTKFLREDWNFEGDTNTMTNDGVSESQWIGYGGGINMYYDINAYNSISSDINFRGRSTPSKNTTILDYNGADTLYNYSSYVNTSNQSTNIEWNSDYTKTFEDNEDRELSLSYQLGRRIKNKNTDIVENNDLIQLTNINDEENTEQTLQLDYTHPINDHKIEVGGKLIYRDQKMDYNTESDSALFVFPKEIFNYSQLVSAFYLSTNVQLPNDYSLLLGTRYELTKIEGDWENNTLGGNTAFALNRSKDPFSKNYGNLLPNLTVSKKLDVGKSLKLSYNSRISRPSSQYINTNTNITNNKNITVGNPNLTPALTKQLEFGYNSFGKKYQGSYYIYFKENTDVIESYLSVVNDTSITTYQNIGKSNRYGFNYYGSIRLKKLTFRTGFNLYSYSAEDSRFSSDERTALLYNYNFGVTLKMKNNWKVEGFGFMRSPSQTLQGTSTSFSMMSFGIKKDFKNKRGSLGIRIVEPFAKNGNKIFISELSGNNFNQSSERTILFTSIGISFKYTFGKLNFKSSSKGSKIKNDDVSEEASPQF